MRRSAKYMYVTTYILYMVYCYQEGMMIRLLYVFELLMPENLMIANFKDPHVFVHIICVKKTTLGNKLHNIVTAA